MAPDLELMLSKLPPLKNRIAEWRTARKLNQRELAEKMGIEHTTLGRLERDEIPVTTEYLTTISRLLDVHPVELIIDIHALAVTTAERDAIEALRSMSEEERAATLLLLLRKR